MVLGSSRSPRHPHGCGIRRVQETGSGPLILIPYLRTAGVRYRPRFDFRDSGLGHTLRLGGWTVLVVAVNQIAYTVVVRLASGGTAEVVGACGTGAAGEGTGYSVYSTAFLIVMVPHSIVTVSLATAVLPRLSGRAADGDLQGLASSLASTLRMALVLIVPFALLMPVLAGDVANAISFGAARPTFENYAMTLGLFGPGLLFFTVHYLMLRGLFALERTRTVFWVQCVIAGTNVAVAVMLVGATGPRLTAPSLAVAYGSSYVVGSVLSYLLLRRTLGGLESRRLLGFLSRLLSAALAATAVAYLVARGLHTLLDQPSQLMAALLVLVVATSGAIVFMSFARLLRIPEAHMIVGFATRRMRRRR